MIGLSISVPGWLPRTGAAVAPVEPPTAGVMAFHGDSFAEGSSGGGGVGAYDSLQPVLRRYLLATGTGYRTENHALTGSGSAHALATWRARGVPRRYNYICTGRNDAGLSVAAILGNIDLMLADRRAGEVVILGSVHNFNDGSEDLGSAGHARCLALNAGLAARADGAAVFYADHRGEAVREHNRDWPADVARAARDLPSAMLTVAGADALHLNGAGCEMQARMILGCVLTHRALSGPAANLLTNADFAQGTAQGWIARNGAVLAAESGGVGITGAGAYKGLAQTVIAANAQGRRVYARWDVTAIATGGGNALTTRLRRGTGGGTIYAGRDETYPRVARGMFLAAEASEAGLAVQFEAINNAGLDWSLAGLGVHDAYPQVVSEYAPVNIRAPGLAAVPAAGAAVLADPGIWDAYPEHALAFRWLRDGAPVGGAGLSHTPGAADAGHALVFEVTATNAAGATVVATPPVTVLPAGPLMEERFDDLSGWVAGPGNAISLVAGRLRCRNESAGWTRALRTAGIPCQSGAMYRVSYDFLRAAHDGVLRIGWSHDAENIRVRALGTVTGATHDFVAEGGMIHVSVLCDSAEIGAFGDWDSIRVEKL